MTNNTFSPVLITMVFLHFRLIAVMSLIKQTSRACLIPCLWSDSLSAVKISLLYYYTISQILAKKEEVYVLKRHPEMQSVIYVMCL